VREETRKTAEQRFDMEVLEGYGVTECAPVLAANQPGDIQAGTIGKMLPGIEARLEPVAGLDEGGQLWVRGPIRVMSSQSMKMAIMLFAGALNVLPKLAAKWFR